MSRVTRNTTRMAQLDDDDDLMLRLSQSQNSRGDIPTVDDDFHLCLSQTQNTQLNESALKDLDSSTDSTQTMSRVTRNSIRMAHIDVDKDLELRLSQSQSSPMDFSDTEQNLGLCLSKTQNTESKLSTVQDLASSTTNIQVNIARIQQVIKQNHRVFSKQHDVLLNLVSDISVNVAEISDRVSKLEKKVCNVQKSVQNNRIVIDDVLTDMEKIKKSVKLIKQKQSHNIKSDEYEERLKLIETRLKERENNQITTNNSVDDKCVIIRNLPFGMRDKEDVQQLLHDGLGLDINIKSIHREQSVNHQAGVLTVELATTNEKHRIIANKRLLSRTEKYRDVYIDGGNRSVNKRIEKKIEMLVSNLQCNSPTQMRAHSRTYYNRNRSQNYYNQ